MIVIYNIVCKMSFRAMHDYSMGTSRKHAKSRTGHNADISGTWHMAQPSAMHKIPLDGTTGSVYHRCATIELALTRVINNFNMTFNTNSSMHTNVKQYYFIVNIPVDCGSVTRTSHGTRYV